MRLPSLIVCLLLAVQGLNGADPASSLYRLGQQAERAGEFVRAYLLYAEAAALDPDRPIYWLRSQALRTRAALKAEVRPHSPDPQEGDEASTIPEPMQMEKRVPDRELAEARRPLPLPELEGSPDRKTVDFRGDSKSLFEQIAQTFNLSVVFDSDYEAGPSVHFRLEETDYREALHALEAASGSFLVPLTERLFLVVQDTPQKRIELEPAVSVVVPIPEPVSLQDAQELARAVQQAMEIQRFAVDSQRRLVVFRDRVSKVRPAQKLFQRLLRQRPQVAIEVEFLEVSRRSLVSYGLLTQTSSPVVLFGKVLNSLPLIPSGFSHFGVLGGGKTLLGLGMANAELFARMSRSVGRSLMRAEIRSVGGQPATFHIGDKYPILTAGYFGRIEEEGEVFAPPPSFTFEDLGLLLNITPYVHGMEDISLDVDAEFKVLAGESVNGIPVLANRTLQSTVRLRTGQWALIAGLMSSSEARSISGLAGLSTLPVLGPLFRQTSKNSDSNAVVLLLKPRLLSLPPEEFVAPAIRVGSETRPLTPL